MGFFKRIGLFVLTNIAVIFLFSIIIYLIKVIFGIDIIAMSGTSYTGLLIYAAIFGFTGSFFSLFISKWSAKKAYKIQLISPEKLGTISRKEEIVYNVVLDIANKHGIKTPEIGIYQSQSPNAFATGASKNSSLVAVSTGLLESMGEKEIEGVVAHEMAHVLNGDMVTMALLQGIMNTFVIFFARIIAEIVNSRTDGKLGGLGYMAVYIGLQVVLGMMASIIVMGFSRHREYRADEGSARFVGKDKMIAALEALKKSHISKPVNEKYAAMQIATPKQVGWKMLFSSHPSLEKRIQHLEDMRMM